MWPLQQVPQLFKTRLIQFRPTTMAHKASNKRRRTDSIVPKESSSATPPVIFETPGLKPGVRLTVFSAAFHCHSVLLKLHSSYFRQFLDSPDKSDAPASIRLRYEYVSVMDKDGTWGLEPADKVDFFHSLDAVVLRAEDDVEHRH